MPVSSASRPWLLWLLGAVAVGFGLITLRSGGLVLFGPAEARMAAGDYVPFVLWFNFLAGFAYIASGIGLFLRQRWGVALALAIAITTAMAYAALGLHIAADGAYEARTVGAMAVRLAVWVGIFLVGRRTIGCRARRRNG